MPTRTIPRYSSSLIKGGGLVPDMRTLTRAWAGGQARAALEQNVLALPSRRRAQDVVGQVFARRFVRSSPPDLWRPLAVLEEAGWPSEQIVPIHYYAAAEAEPLIPDLVADFLAPRFGRGVLDVSTDDVVRFIESSSEERFPHGRWSAGVTRRVAENALTALRDFGVLVGAAKKRIRSPNLPVESFAFLARLRASLGVTGRAAIHEPIWQLFFLSDLAVERLFLEAHQERLLTYDAAGSIVRIDFPGNDLLGYAHELAERSDRMARV